MNCLSLSLFLSVNVCLIETSSDTQYARVYISVYQRHFVIAAQSKCHKDERAPAAVDTHVARAGNVITRKHHNPMFDADGHTHI